MLSYDESTSRILSYDSTAATTTAAAAGSNIKDERGNKQTSLPNWSGAGGGASQKILNTDCTAVSRGRRHALHERNEAEPLICHGERKMARTKGRTVRRRTKYERRRRRRRRRRGDQDDKPLAAIDARQSAFLSSSAS